MTPVRKVGREYLTLHKKLAFENLNKIVKNYRYQILRN